jgi:Xaa-Pro aminopeptidase
VTPLLPDANAPGDFAKDVWSSYNHSSLENIAPISRTEFLSRQSKLISQLGQEGVDAFIAEPGASAQFYANVSSYNWGLSERPFVFVATQEEVFFLTPTFELSRAKRLDIVWKEPKYVTWDEGYVLLELPDNRALALQNSYFGFEKIRENYD